MHRRQRLLVAAMAVLLSVATAPAQTPDPLYVCAEDTDSRVLEIGVTVCNATPTDLLRARLQPDNLQLREGALVTEASEDGIGGIAGLQPGDVIYRIGGADVSDPIETAARMSLIAIDADTIVNFLRRGRPYRVKLRAR